MTRWCFCAVLSAAFLAGCANKPAAKEPLKQYALRGEVLRLDAEHKLAVIKHEKIEGWMEAMTMEFPVRDASEFAKLKPGQRIAAKVYVQDLDYWIGEVNPQ